MDRRQFVRRATGVSIATLVGGTSMMRRSLAQAAVVPGAGPYGPLQAANADGIQLPVGFSSRLIAVSGQPVANTGFVWHAAPDGGACFPVMGGGWVYVSNSEVSGGGGGASVVKFDSAATIVGAYRILSGTHRNCAGGATPSGKWLSCEENGAIGRVFECDPQQPSQGVVRPALGLFNHEAAFVDPATGYVYLTEDAVDGRFYRFVPTTTGDLSAGQLFAASVTNGLMTWFAATASGPDRQAATTAFNGGEGIFIDGRSLYFTTKGDKKVWDLNLDTQAISVLYDGNTTPGAALNAVDNVTVHPLSGDIYVAEDGGNLELCLIADVNGATEVAPFLRFVGHDLSEVAGPAFAPNHQLLYVTSQRGTNGQTGRTYEITGPFRTSAPPPPPPDQVLVPAGSTWRYFDKGTVPGAGWNGYHFADSAWPTGLAPLGYGDPMATTIGFGPSSSTKYITTYFRGTFNADHGYHSLTVSLQRDDGAVIYINGVEAARSNMPAGAIGNTTKAPTVVNGADETRLWSIPVSATLYHGTNVIAIEIHQQSATSTDIGFDLSLTGAGNTGPLAPPPPPPVPETLVATGSVWKYNDAGGNLGTAWRDRTYDDSSWNQGVAPLGYGDPMATRVGYGPAKSAKYITTYFRRSFTATHGFASVTLNLRRDDGAVVYINGLEVARSNMPTASVTSTTRASSTVSGTAETKAWVIPVSPTLFTGTNVIAVEIHQDSPSSSDLGVDLSLVGTGNTGPLAAS